MNLAQIRGRIKNQIDYTPVPSVALSRYIDGVINDAYNDIWLTRPFTFNIKEEEIRVWDDITPTDLTWNTNITCTFTVNSNVITFSASPIQSASIPDDEVRDKYIGAFIQAGGNGGIEYYQIVAQRSSTQWKIDRPFIGPTAAYTGWKIIHRYSYLPQDTIEIMDITFNNFPINGSRRGKIHSVPQRLANSYNFDEEVTGGKPVFYVPYSKHHTQESVNELSLAVAGAGSGIGVGPWVFGYTMVDADGAESGMCDVKQIAGVAGTDQVTISLANAVNIGDASTDVRYKIYFAHKATGQDNYKFFHIGTIGALVDAALVTSIVWTSTENNKFKRGGYRDQWKEVVSSKYVRFQPRPQTVDETITNPDPNNWNKSKKTFYTLRYLYKPDTLVNDYDTPKIPEEFHHLIVDRALIDVHMKYNNPQAAQIHQQKFDERMVRLQARYASERDATVQRGRSMQVGNGLTRGRLNINYLG